MRKFLRSRKLIRKKRRLRNEIFSFSKKMGEGLLQEKNVPLVHHSNLRGRSLIKHQESLDENDRFSNSNQNENTNISEKQLRRTNSVFGKPRWDRLRVSFNAKEKQNFKNWKCMSLPASSRHRSTLLSRNETFSTENRGNTTKKSLKLNLSAPPSYPRNNEALTPPSTPVDNAPRSSTGAHYSNHTFAYRTLSTTSDYIVSAKRDEVNRGSLGRDSLDQSVFSSLKQDRNVTGPNNHVKLNETPRKWPYASRTKLTLTKAQSIVGSVHWHMSSTCNAVTERSVELGRTLPTLSGRFIKYCSEYKVPSFNEMAESKFQTLKKSLSSWSLTNIKKSSVRLPKYKQIKKHLFKKQKRNDGDETTSAEQVSIPSDDTSLDRYFNNGDCSETESQNGFHNPENSSTNDSNTSSDVEYNMCQGYKQNIVGKRLLNNSDNNEIHFIDEDLDESGCNDEYCLLHCHDEHKKENELIWYDMKDSDDECIVKNRVPNENDRYFDQDIDYEFYDPDDTKTLTPKSAISYEEGDEQILGPITGSVKAREWVKSFEDEKSVDLIKESDNKERSNSPQPYFPLRKRSKSELFINVREKFGNIYKIPSIQNLFHKNEKKSDTEKQKSNPQLNNIRNTSYLSRSFDCAFNDIDIVEKANKYDIKTFKMDSNNIDSSPNESKLKPPEEFKSQCEEKLEANHSVAMDTEESNIPVLISTNDSSSPSIDDYSSVKKWNETSNDNSGTQKSKLSPNKNSEFKTSFTKSIKNIFNNQRNVKHKANGCLRNETKYLKFNPKPKLKNLSNKTGPEERLIQDNGKDEHINSHIVSEFNGSEVKLKNGCRKYGHQEIDVVDQCSIENENKICRNYNNISKNEGDCSNTYNKSIKCSYNLKKVELEDKIATPTIKEHKERVCNLRMNAKSVKNTNYTPEQQNSISCKTILNSTKKLESLRVKRLYENQLFERKNSKNECDNRHICDNSYKENKSTRESTINSYFSLDSDVKNPVPKPRSKKSKYGYAKRDEVICSSNRSSVNVETLYSLNEESEDESEPFLPPKSDKIQKTENKFRFEKFGRGISKSNIYKRNKKNISMPTLNGSNEPIYWEIDDDIIPPKVTPRKKKRDRDHSKCTPEKNRHLCENNANTSDMPDWIQNRPPIPSPRTKKLRSTQSLNPTNLNYSSDYSTDQTSCSSLRNFALDHSITKHRIEEDPFYSGKAASISYGRTTYNTQQVSPNLRYRSQVMNGNVQNPHKNPDFNSNLEIQNGSKSRDISVFRSLPKQNPKDTFLPQEFFEHHVKNLMSNVTSSSKVSQFASNTQELLADALFAIFTVVGEDNDREWTVVHPGKWREERKRTVLTLGQMKSHVQEVFQLPVDKFNNIIYDVQSKKANNLVLRIKIIEANNLRPKTVRGGSNPFVVGTVSGVGGSCRTRVERETLNPKWNQELQLKLENINEEHLKLEVWHDLELNSSLETSGVKDLRSLSRWMKETTAIVHKQNAHLLGSVSVPLSDIGEKGIEESLLLVKETQKEERKERGSLLIEGFITSSESLLSSNEARRNHDALLAKLVYHYIKSSKNNNKENFSLPWYGHLQSESLAVLANHAIVFGVRYYQQNLSWWIVGSKVPSADVGWQLNQLKVVQKHLASGKFDEDDLEDLAESLSLWVHYSLLKLRNLSVHFPPSSGILAKHQLSSLLTIFNALDKNVDTRSLLERKEISNLKFRVEEATTNYAKCWWTKLVEEQLAGETKPESQIQKIIVITNEVFYFLSDIAAFYSPALLKEMNIAYFREIYLMITRKVQACVRPSLMNMYNLYDYMVEETPKITAEGDEGHTIFSLQDGSILWQLYMNLGRIYKIGDDLPEEVKKESGLFEYHNWFNKGVRRWVDLARRRALLMIEKAVNLDTFEPVDQYCNFSSSATDVSGIFTDVQIWWRKLEWPDPENSMILLAKILEDVCSYAIRYADLLEYKVGDMFTEQKDPEKLKLSKQICTGLNNIEKIRNLIMRLPEMFDIQHLLLKVRNSKESGAEVAIRFNNNIRELIESSSESMEGKIMDFIEAVLEKILGALQTAVSRSCEAGSEKHLLDMLDPALHLLRTMLSDKNFRRFLIRLWEEVVRLLHSNVSQNTGRRKASYFESVYEILSASLEFFNPSDEVGIGYEASKTQEYVALLELLECWRLSSESLISKYYSERLDEQNLLNVSARGELVVRAFFTKGGKLIVEVIMAKDMSIHQETGSTMSKASQNSTQTTHIDSYVKVRLVPMEWFPQVHEFRTKIMKSSDPAVFEETIEMDLRCDDDGVSNGFILFTLKSYRLSRSNTFIGEALLSLGKLPCVDSSQVHQVHNTYLKVTQPGLDVGYRPIRALKLRTADKVASNFVKKFNNRIPGGLKMRSPAVSSDEDKTRPKSPLILRKMGFS